MLDVKINEAVADRIIKAWREFHYSLSGEEILIVLTKRRNLEESPLVVRSKTILGS